MSSKKLKVVGLMSLALIGVTGVSVFASTEGLLGKSKTVEVSVGTAQRVDLSTGEVTDLDMNELKQLENGEGSDEFIISAVGGTVKINEDGSEELLSEEDLLGNSKTVEVSVGTAQRVDLSTGEVTDLDMNELKQLENGEGSNEFITSAVGGNVQINEDGSEEVLSEEDLLGLSE